ncbi:hypothetical protein QYF61_006969 [Mycteria americana]|uniref:Uncharacterized protein n=1 Tax=Mycteria americana TaxID=33587 RepID=A0AAN7MHV0_MYCAM|nr:hypothetical protein QYF61_006969 [Mycteria americana]
MQHGCDQAARALRPYTNARDHKESGILELLVPHAVDEGVQCWRNHRVQNCHHQIQRRRGDGWRLQVGKHGSNEKQGEHSQVREARGKGFVLSLLRGDPQHSPEDLHIGQHNENKTPKCKRETKHKKPSFPEGIGHGFRDSGGDGAQVENREVEEEEVHGGVEAVVTGYSSDDEAVAQEGSQVDAQEEPEVQELQLPPVCKCQEEELGDGAGHLPSALCLDPWLVLANCAMKSRASAHRLLISQPHSAEVEGHGHVAGELQHGSAGALAAEEVVHALDPTALRAEALLGGTGVIVVFTFSLKSCIGNILGVMWSSEQP